MGTSPDSAGGGRPYRRVMSVPPTTRRRRPLRAAAAVAGVVVGLYLFGRALAEPFLINLSDPATYRDDWGGPSLAGVLAVHCGPGLLAGAAMVIGLIRGWPGRRPRS
jgi:hypothetical protein